MQFMLSVCETLNCKHTPLTVLKKLSHRASKRRKAALVRHVYVLKCGSRKRGLLSQLRLLTSEFVVTHPETPKEDFILQIHASTEFLARS